MLPRVEGKNELFGVEVIVNALIPRQIKRKLNYSVKVLSWRSTK